VLRDRIFVQTGKTTQVKFKSSVAGALHPGTPKGPELEQVNVAEMLCGHGRAPFGVDGA
jgi:hypothetical protein